MFLRIYLFIHSLAALGGGYFLGGVTRGLKSLPIVRIFSLKNGRIYSGGGLTCKGIRGGCRPNGLLFHQKSLNIGSILVKKSLEGPISQNKRNCTIRPPSRFWHRKTLTNGSQFAKISRKLSIHFSRFVLFCFFLCFVFVLFFLSFFFF